MDAEQRTISYLTGSAGIGRQKKAHALVVGLISDQIIALPGAWVNQGEGSLLTASCIHYCFLHLWC
jgi:hypothetical protein